MLKPKKYTDKINWKNYIDDTLGEYGISWCEGGSEHAGNVTTKCKECIYFSPEECEAVKDALSEEYSLACELIGSEYITHSVPAYMKGRNYYHLHRLPHNEGYIMRYDFDWQVEHFGDQIRDSAEDALEAEAITDSMPKDVYKALYAMAKEVGWINCA